MTEKIEAVFDGDAELLNKQISPKVDKFQRGYIYVLKLSNGFTKVGSTAEPVSRMKSLKRGLRSTSVTLDRLWLSVSHINYKDNEKAALTYLEDKERDGEFFKVPFNDALSVVLDLQIKTSFTLEEIEAKQAHSAAFIESLNHLHALSREQKTKA